MTTLKRKGTAMNRTAKIERNTKETQISLTLALDGGANSIDTGIGFFDHMLEAFAVHSGFSLSLKVNGDLHVDPHHTVEDTGIALGQALYAALGDKTGIRRFGQSAVPMDESLCESVVDICNRPFLVLNADFRNEKIGELDTCLVREFMYALCFNAKITAHINLRYGDNDHHKCEAVFKSFARALSEAVQRTGKSEVLSSKGVL